MRHYKPDPLSLDSAMCLALGTWTPYYPEGYPIRDGVHNPWVIVDPISQMTAYQVWLTMERTADERAFRQKLADLRSIQ